MPCKHYLHVTVHSYTIAISKNFSAMRHSSLSLIILERNNEKFIQSNLSIKNQHIVKFKNFHDLHNLGFVSSKSNQVANF